MANYTQVQEALRKGVEPALICSTCPWDRLCINPPEMSSNEIESQIASAWDSTAEKNSEKEDKSGSVMSALFATMLFAGKDTSASVCPVLVARMQASNGRAIVDTIRAMMKSWDDDSVQTMEG